MQLVIIILQTILIICLCALIKLLYKGIEDKEDFSIETDAIIDEIRTIKPYLESIHRKYEGERTQINLEMARHSSQTSWKKD